MKTVAKFWGKVNRISAVPEPSYVTLKDQTTNESYDTSAVTEKLLEKGIDHDGCEFEVVVQEDLTGKVTAELTKLEPKPITPERIAEIKKNSVEDGPSDPKDRMAMLEEKIRRLEALLDKKS